MLSIVNNITTVLKLGNIEKSKPHPRNSSGETVHAFPAVHQIVISWEAEVGPCWSLYLNIKYGLIWRCI